MNRNYYTASRYYLYILFFKFIIIVQLLVGYCWWLVLTVLIHKLKTIYRFACLIQQKKQSHKLGTHTIHSCPVRTHTRAILIVEVGTTRRYTSWYYYYNHVIINYILYTVIRFLIKNNHTTYKSHSFRIRYVYVVSLHHGHAFSIPANR